MTAQAYFDDPQDPNVRIFPASGSSYIAQLPVHSKNLTADEADKALHRAGFRRRGKWIETEWGYEAPVRFKEKRGK